MAILRQLSGKLTKIRIEKQLNIFGGRDCSIVDDGNSFLRQVHALRVHVTLVPEGNVCSDAIRLGLNRYLATNCIGSFPGSDRNGAPLRRKAVEIFCVPVLNSLDDGHEGSQF